MPISLVDTPQALKRDQRTTKQLHLEICREIRENQCWTESCTAALKESLSILFHFDRLHYVLGNAFGDQRVKIALNPMMLLCYHPKCLNTNKGANPVRLHDLNNIRAYLMHLLSHNDVLGIAMQERFKAVYEEPFCDIDLLDKKASSPFSLMESLPVLPVDIMGRYAIRRDFNPGNINYVCHWKNILISSNLLTPSSLSFQEDDALLELYLRFPNPLQDWTVYKTLVFYFIKCYCSISSTALNLFRGITDYPHLSKNPMIEANKFLSNVNHPGPSLTTIQRWFPSVSYETNQFHRKYLLFHLKAVKKNPSIVINFDNVVRFPAVLVIDEQEINQGTFIENNVLHGLSKKLSCDEIKSIGLKNLPRHTSSKNPFLASVREYRLTDLGGVMCSNVYTSFESLSIPYDVCVSSLMKVVKLAKSCEECLKDGLVCTYEVISKQCGNCQRKGTKCESLVVFHVLWDMGSSQKKASNTITKIDEISTNSELLNSCMFTVGFGGLHLCKGGTNGFRNFVLNMDGERFGLNILRSLKNGDGHVAETLSTIKTAVFLAKDRQSDYLSYLSSGETVQKALSLKNEYNVIRCPEKILNYTDSAKKQKPMIYPVAIQCNVNGDVFILDSGSCTIHVIDNSTVAKMYEVGNYKIPNLMEYPQTNDGAKKMTAKNVRLGNHLTSMVMVKDDLYIADASRKEVIILRGCRVAKDVEKSTFHILKTGVCLSLGYCDESLALLKDSSDDQLIEIVNVVLPDSKHYTFILPTKVMQVVVPSRYICSLFLLTINDKKVLGAMSKENEIFFYTKEKKMYNEKSLSIKSAIAPSSSSSSAELIILPTDVEQLQQLALDNSCNIIGYSTIFSESMPVVTTIWEKTIFIVGKARQGYVLEECGKLNFAAKFCHSLNKFYHAISYIPPHGLKNNKKKNFTDCIADAETVVDLLTSMQKDRECKFPSRKSFMGPNGAIFTGTVQCFENTVKSWKALARRLDFFDTSLVPNLYPHAITNESLIEHSFGFVVKQGQSQLQSMYEYVHAKSRHEIDFQMRMTDMPFNQYTKVKLRDKGYQHLDDSFKTKLDMADFWEIFSEKTCKEKEKETTAEISEEEKNILYQAFLLKVCPRRSNRSKWKEESGFAPNLMEDKTEAGKLITGDLVLCKSFNKVLFMKVKEDVILDNKDAMVSIQVLNDETGIHDDHVNVGSLLTDKGFIITIPQVLYKVVEGTVRFNDIIAPMVADVMQNIAHERCGYSDEELAILPDVSPDELILDDRTERRTSSLDFQASEGISECSGRAKRKISDDEEVIRWKKRKRVICESSEDEDDSAEPLQAVWRRILPPVKVTDVVDEWFACIFMPSEINSKQKPKKPQLIFGRLKSRIMMDDRSFKVQIEECKPYDLSSKPSFVEEVPLGKDLYNYNLHDVIAGPLNLTYDKNNRWEVEEIDVLIQVFNNSVGIDRYKILEGLLRSHCCQDIDVS